MTPVVNDVSTVISILPFEIRERKPGLVPGEFYIPSARTEFQTLAISRCTFPVYLDDSRPPLIVPDPSDQVAESIVRDFKVAVLGYTNGVAEPGLFWVLGGYGTRQEIKTKFAAEFKQAEELQKAWFIRLVEIADDDWARYHQHKFVSSVQRFAADAMNLKKEWNVAAAVTAASIRCKFCATVLASEAQIVCGTCHGVLDKARYDKEFVMAK